MTLGDIALPIDCDDARGLALVFTPQLAARLAQLHGQYGSTNCVPSPCVLADGRLALGADLLTEIKPGGLLHAMWEAADKTILNAQVEVYRWDEMGALLPPPPPPVP